MTILPETVPAVRDTHGHEHPANAIINSEYYSRALATSRDVFIRFLASDVPQRADRTFVFLRALLLDGCLFERRCC
jgi:hypothetical protein